LADVLASDTTADDRLPPDVAPNVPRVTDAPADVVDAPSHDHPDASSPVDVAPDLVDVFDVPLLDLVDVSSALDASLDVTDASSDRANTTSLTDVALDRFDAPEVSPPRDVPVSVDVLAPRDTTPPVDAPTDVAARDIADVVCVPRCGGRMCGDDGCGGSCAPGCAMGQRCVAATGLCAVPEVTWARPTLSAAPNGRHGASMAYDSARGVVVLFGGNSTASTYDGVTWERGLP
jgi:hypothetical protein